MDPDAPGRGEGMTRRSPLIRVLALCAALGLSLGCGSSEADSAAYQEAVALLEAGDRLMAAGDPAAAGAAFQGARETGWTSADLEHRLANALLGTGESGRAIAHFERARRLAPRDRSIHADLASARQSLSARRDVPHILTEPATLRLGFSGLLIIGLAMFVLGAALVGVGRRRYPSVRGLGSATLWMGATILLLGIGVRWAALAPRAAVLTTTEIRADPADGADPVGSASPGDLVFPGSTQAEWRAIRAPGMTRGFVRAEALEDI
ncbi:hypothetical protein BH23BAC4_BH23BAC4_13280 [soil metagenome]